VKRDEVDPEGRWEFDVDVAEAFEDMLARSIPQYDVMREAVFEVGSAFVQKETAIVDLGCSRGAALEPFVKRFGPRNRYVGCEISEPMIAAARERFGAYDGVNAWNGVSSMVSIRKLDLRTEYPAELASLTLSVLTLQFTPIEYRPRILREVRKHTHEDGAFVIVEKVLGDVAETDALMVDLYHGHKRRAGYSDEQIVRKAAALEGVLVPLTARFDVELVRDAGFRTVECFWRWMNFAAWVAVP